MTRRSNPPRIRRQLRRPASVEVIEVVASGREPALIGLALKTPDLDATVAQIRRCGGPVSDPKPAVQGGRIASVSSEHLNWGLAVMGT